MGVRIRYTALYDNFVLRYEIWMLRRLQKDSVELRI